MPLIALSTCWSDVLPTKRLPRLGVATFSCHSRTNLRPLGVGRKKRMPLLKVPAAWYAAPPPTARPGPMLSELTATSARCSGAHGKRELGANSPAAAAGVHMR